MNQITFKIEEVYRKIGFITADEFTLTVHNLSKKQAEWLRNQIFFLILNDAKCVEGQVKE